MLHKAQQYKIQNPSPEYWRDLYYFYVRLKKKWLIQ